MPVRGDRWPDFLSQEGERKVWLELVEVVNPELGGRAYRESVPVSVEYARGLLVGTIRGKLTKGYARPSDASLWLLAYDNTDAMFYDNDYAADLGVPGAS